MQANRFQEILQDVDRTDWQGVMSILNAAFSGEYPNEAGRASVYCDLCFNWGYNYPHLPGEDGLAPEEVLPFLKSLPEDAILCLDRLSLYPQITWAGKKPFRIQRLGFTGNVGPRWQTLRLRIGKKKLAVSRQDLYSGCTVAGTPEGILKAFSVDDYGITLTGADGKGTVELYQNQEFFHPVAPGVEAMIEYNHKEFPARWSWLHVDDYTEGGDNPWYTRHHEEKKDLYEGYDVIAYAPDDVPQVTIVKMKPRSVTVRVWGKGVDKEVVLDKPNHKEVIWQKGKRSLIAMLYVTEPRISKAWSYYGEQIPPAGCRAEAVMDRKVAKVDVRSLYCYLRPEEGTGGWNWPCVWGFFGGKMVLGSDNPSPNGHFLGLLPEGETATFQIDDNNSYKDDDDVINTAEVSVSWRDEKIGFEIVDGELKSVPDAEEIPVPEGVTSIYYEALLTAPSLRRIVIPAEVTGFANAIGKYHRVRGRKLDVVFKGSLQDWFNRAYNLCNHIGELVIDGKKQDFYHKKHLEIPRGITHIGADFFNGSKVLQSLVLGEDVVSIGDSAFRNCDALLSVKVLGPAKVGVSAFCSCDSLEEVYLADGVQALYDGCFDFVETLKEVYIPESVKVVQRLSSQNDGRGILPAFRCAAKKRPAEWWDTWNLAYYDPRFGYGHGYDYYHPVKWGAQR